MEFYLKAIQSDVQQKKSILGLNIAKFVLWQEVLTDYSYYGNIPNLLFG